MAYIQLYLATGDEKWSRKAKSLYSRSSCFTINLNTPPKFIIHAVSVLITSDDHRLHSQMMRALSEDTSLYDDTLIIAWAKS